MISDEVGEDFGGFNLGSTPIVQNNEHYVLTIQNFGIDISYLTIYVWSWYQKERFCTWEINSFVLYGALNPAKDSLNH